MSDHCPIQRWFARQMCELRRFIREAEEDQALALLHQVHEDLEASRKRHREKCPNCAGRPTYGHFVDDPEQAESLGVDLGDVTCYKSERPAPSRRETTRCRRH